MGGEKYRNVADFRKKRPEFIIMNAVKGMLPKNKLADPHADQTQSVPRRRTSALRSTTDSISKLIYLFYECQNFHH